MRIAVLALAMVPMAAHAQSTTLPTPTEPVAQSQSCPTGMTWDAAAQSCALSNEAASPVQALPGKSGCSYGAAREVTS